ncbi:MAG: PGPGW domain-containing protein [Woeseiaceae bacterium]
MKPIQVTYKLIRRVAVISIGLTILAIGVVMVVMPGPAIVMIPVGLAILGLEFAWARVLLGKLRRSISNNNAESLSMRAEHHRDRHAHR